MKKRDRLTNTHAMKPKLVVFAYIDQSILRLRLLRKGLSFLLRCSSFGNFPWVRGLRILDIAVHMSTMHIYLGLHILKGSSAMYSAVSCGMESQGNVF